MKAHAYSKAKSSTRVNHQQVIFELKQRVGLALNKLADRDTYQIGVEELERIAQCLNPDGVAPFLSCILDTDSEQKSAVRKECIRLMGLLITLHEGLIGPHLGKIVASIVKRLKDPDSAVRDVCVETVGVLASKLSNDDGVFVSLVKPLFEALSEQNKQVQFGAALCLAGVIDNTSDPPVPILQRMLTKTIKILKNPHFMAKPAVIELNRSIIQAGGAPTKTILSAALSSIQEALKSSDWTTRKAASVSLGRIASSGRPFFSSFKASCIHSLESCRFDKVKPVRETVLQALHLWKSLPGPGTPEPSEAGSSIKGSYYGGDYGDISSMSDFGRKDVSLTKLGSSLIKKRNPLSVRKACQSYLETQQHPKEDDWHIEIAVPKSHNISVVDGQNEESEGSSVTKTLERTRSDVTNTQDIGYEYVSMDERQECSSVSNLVSNNFETKFMMVSHDHLKEDGFMKQIGRNRQLAAEEFSGEEQRYSVGMKQRTSLDSTVTETDLSSQAMRECCLQTMREITSIRKHLLEIENKQSNLMDMIKVFTTNTVDSLSLIQMKVSGLEHVVDQIAQDLVHGKRHSDLGATKLVKKSPIVSSPRVSTCTPRPSIDVRGRLPSILSAKNTDFWEEKSSARSRSNGSVMQVTNTWSNGTRELSSDTMGMGSQRNCGLGTHFGQMRQTDTACGSASTSRGKQENSENRFWKLVNNYLLEGDLDSAYAEALCSCNELVLIKLIDRTGPALESLSQKTAGALLSTLASYFFEQRFVNSIIPWLQQVVDLSAIHGPNCLALSAKERQEFLSAIQEGLDLGFSNLAERRSLTQLQMKLQQIWGKSS
ncbi:TORTIFOLIA1-like protein 2 isoform X2 [Diospyros lotus]|uniref:TORTIFOLIA1-like protein 2 isoform X2 n=1 Tax=Diospyros lotus TaxID=55363 RepID=UPI002259154B|nr:TORTIFOLIA1-like protein 2 isoform X2 [Diospyros lotus]